MLEVGVAIAQEITAMLTMGNINAGLAGGAKR